MILQVILEGIGPVAYTHLDVYKRQGYYPDGAEHGGHQRGDEGAVSGDRKAVRDDTCLLYTSFVYLHIVKARLLHVRL